MKLYYVDPPTYEGEPEGADGREWFSSLEEARKRFNHWKKEIDDVNEDNPNRLTYASVMLAFVMVELTRKDLLFALNHHMSPTDYIDEYPKPKED